MNKIKTESPAAYNAIAETFEDDITPSDVWLLSEPWELDTVTDSDLKHEILESFNLHCEME